MNARPAANARAGCRVQPAMITSWPPRHLALVQARRAAGTIGRVECSSTRCLRARPCRRRPALRRRRFRDVRRNWIRPPLGESTRATSAGAACARTSGSFAQIFAVLGEQQVEREIHEMRIVCRSRAPPAARGSSACSTFRMQRLHRR